MIARLRTILAALGLLSAALSSAQEMGPSRVIDRGYFGMHIHRAAAGTPWPGVEFGSWRLWDAHVTWRDLEPFKGYWRFDTLDRLVSMAEERHVSLMLTLGSTPVWASARPAEACSAGGRGCAAEPESLEDWEDYVRAVVTRYRGRIDAYELWNEVHFSDLGDGDLYDANGTAYFFSGSSAKMVELARSTHRIIKEIDAGAMLASPSMHVYGDWIKRLRLYFDAGGAAYTDVVSFHFYASSPEDTLRTIRAVRAAMHDHGLDEKPLWNTETGFVVQDPSGPPRQDASTPEQVAEFIARSFILDAAAGVERVYWYAWDNQIYGLTTSNGRVPTAAAAGYAAAEDWLVGATVRACQRHADGVWACEVEKDGKMFRAVWRAEGAVAWPLPAEWRVSAFKPLLPPDGPWIPLVDRHAQIGSNPLLFRSD